MLTPIVFILFLLVWPVLGHADFQAGEDAYDREDYATALKEWRPLAEQGNADAQFNLGVMYEQGQGLSTAFEVRLEEVGLVGPDGVDPCILYDP